MEISKLHIANAVLMPEIASLLNEGHTVTLLLKGNSMRPYLVHMRDKALLELPKAIKVGDVVLAEVSPERYVLHRVIKIENGNEGPLLTLRGDGNFCVETCRMVDVIAKATAFYRKGSTTPQYVYTFGYQLYSWLWMNLYPLRRYLLKIHDILFHSLKDLTK